MWIKHTRYTIDVDQGVEFRINGDDQHLRLNQAQARHLARELILAADIDEAAMRGEYAA